MFKFKTKKKVSGDSLLRETLAVIAWHAMISTSDDYVRQSDFEEHLKIVAANSFHYADAFLAEFSKKEKL